ncbi:hypothetical protein HS088_TW04G00110 [Tripterygium wilfordii]|uniref:Uncharacterized protein n=1 Tax=Tripterygium wilfordii TaxID=458696 RepID=A0A7J7DP58_TRIWF|nr:uncharacterized protein LOC119996132 [Tripterygium wilfordii]KAF5748160.1 hypothetical protein HS088_TW04G00110 [Tripterygium wilfordii]
MAKLVKCFMTLLILNLATKGTVRSGKEIQGKTEWSVTVTNTCVCAQSRIILRCPGFQSVEHINPDILYKQGDDCVLVRGSSLPASASVTFSYAWDPPFIMFPKSSIIAGC